MQVQGSNISRQEDAFEFKLLRTPMASLAYQAAGLRIYSVAPPAHAGD